MLVWRLIKTVQLSKRFLGNGKTQLDQSLTGAGSSHLKKTDS